MDELSSQPDSGIPLPSDRPLPVGKIKIIVIVLALLVVYSKEFEMTRQRNRVWQSDLTLWTDTLAKSPTNGRVMMNLGVKLMAMGRYELAGYYFERAKLYTPEYWELEVNFGVLKDATGQRPEAELHFKQALFLNPTSKDSYTFYAGCLRKWGRAQEADNLLRIAGLLPGQPAK